MSGRISSLAHGTPLCPAGHLPLKGGDRLGVCSPLSIVPRILRVGSFEAAVMPLVISPPEGEMPGRAEGSDLAPTSILSSRETYHVPRS
ncbi:hypothetical protein EPK99_22225 [Neorhizobium lilium]|uniref:Lytic murein transglycosylase n=1 Tax=Neorhizobium lilium TaxID=2503024 RepID=A0A3S3RQ71_9HYPH|nr:hypothetical protein EPK99_22225 [Neorhizobium lilium]